MAFEFSKYTTPLKAKISSARGAVQNGYTANVNNASGALVTFGVTGGGMTGMKAAGKYLSATNTGALTGAAGAVAGGAYGAVSDDTSVLGGMAAGAAIGAGGGYGFKKRNAIGNSISAGLARFKNKSE